MILIIDFLHLFQILPFDQSDKWRMSNPANERSVTHQVKVHWPILLFWFTKLFFKNKKMEKGVEEIQTRIKKLHYDSTIFDFHYLYLDSGIWNVFYFVTLLADPLYDENDSHWIQILFSPILTSLFPFISLSYSRIGSVIYCY